jgi:hypothetical protein
MNTKKRGRKPVPDPKKRLDVWVNASTIAANGGEDNAKLLCQQYLESKKQP